MQRRAHHPIHRLGTGIVAVVLVAAPLTTGPAVAVTEEEVAAACAESAEAYETYRTQRASFETQAAALEQVGAELDQAEHEEQRIRAIYEQRRSEQAVLREQVESEAAELYMRAVAGPTGGTAIFGTPEDMLAASTFLETVAGQGLQGLNDLGALSEELDGLQNELSGAVTDLTAKREEERAATVAQEEAMAAALSAYDQMSDRCKDIQAEYEAEQARLRAEAEARRQREEAQRRAATASRGSTASSGGGPAPVFGIVCPFARGRTQFIDSWGAPRSGGRSHQGTDMFAPWDEPVYAVAAGTVRTRVGGLGGKTIWVISDGGPAYYYAHLNGFAVSDGQRVAQGELIAYNGNSGNAEGTSPHVHLQIHPWGRSGPPVNPYNTVAAVCF